MTIGLLRELRALVQRLSGGARGGRDRMQGHNDGREMATDAESLASPGSHPFEVQSYIGSEIAQMQEDERPSESAELVASVYLGGNDYRTYLLETHKEGSGGGSSGWTLWQKGSDDDTGQTLYCRLAFGYPYDDSAASFVAERLLTEALMDESRWGMMHTERDGGTVEAEGLLSKHDLRRIFTAVFA